MSATEASAASCCSVGVNPPVTRDQAVALVPMLKAVADPARLQILSLIAAAPAREVCVCDLPEPLGLSQPTVSHHLKILVKAGLLRREARGTWAWYALVPGAADDVLQQLHGLLDAGPDQGDGSPQRLQYSTP